MSRPDLAAAYHGYIDCLNAQDWERLGDFVGADVLYNGTPVGLGGYRSMLERDFAAIPDLRFNIALLVADDTHVASRLDFDCTPKAELFGLPVNGRRVVFSENVFYEFAGERIVSVWSVIDKTAIADQVIGGA